MDAKSEVDPLTYRCLDLDLEPEWDLTFEWDLVRDLPRASGNETLGLRLSEDML